MPKLINFLQTRQIILLFVCATVVLCVAIPVSRVLKRDFEIDHILHKDYQNEYCMQYALIVAKDGLFPCHDCLNATIYLHVGEIWKYGKTCNGISGRYPQGLPFKDLIFQPQFYGTEQACLVEEKNKIYAYPALPECQNRTIKLLRPPGNKIDR